MKFLHQTTKITRDGIRSTVSTETLPTSNIQTPTIGSRVTHTTTPSTFKTFVGKPEQVIQQIGRIIYIVIYNKNYKYALSRRHHNRA